jgi:Zn finger protein HypA/HybF involved in hydrogenase expression
MKYKEIDRRAYARCSDCKHYKSGQYEYPCNECGHEEDFIKTHFVALNTEITVKVGGREE